MVNNKVAKDMGMYNKKEENQGEFVKQIERVNDFLGDKLIKDEIAFAGQRKQK